MSKIVHEHVFDMQLVKKSEIGFDEKIYSKQYFKMRKILTGAKLLLMSI